MAQKETKGINKKILLALAAGAVISMAMVAPGVVLVAKPFLDWQRYDKRRIREALKKMKRRRIIEFRENKNGETIIKITKKGKERVLKYKLQDLTIPKPNKWDGLWRIVIFDIPNKKKLARDTLRNKLQNLGFYKIQKSVFVYPYECEDEIEFIKAIFNIQQYVLLIRAKEIDNEELLHHHFNLI